MNTCATCKWWHEGDEGWGTCSLASDWRSGALLRVVGGGDMFAWLRTGAGHCCARHEPREGEPTPCCWNCKHCEHLGPFCRHPENSDSDWLCWEPFTECSCGGSHFEKGT